MQKLNQTRIIRILRIVMPIVGIITAVIFVPWTALYLLVAPVSATVQEEINNSIDRGFDGIIVYADQGGEDAALYAAGWNNRAEETPADPNSLFRIASISKLYIATATTMMVNDGLLSLDDTLADYFPEFVDRIENADQITVRMMVQHRSGIPNYTDDPNWLWGEVPADLDAHLALALDKPANFAPDTNYRYSNTNYLLIGDILDQVLGYSHHQYIREEITEPLGLTDTYSLTSEINLDDLMSGYYYGYEDDFKEIDHIAPGGTMIATAEDVGVFLRALNDGSLLSEEEQEIYASIYEFGHTGWVLGYQSIARYNAETDTVLVMFVNSTGGETEEIIGIVYNRIDRILSQ